MSVLLFLVLCYVNARIVGQVATEIGTSIMGCYLDKNNEYMWKTGMFTREEATEFARSAERVLSIITNTYFESCPTDPNTGIVKCDNYVLFPFAVSYTITTDTKYPERPGAWLGIEFGYIATNSTGAITQISHVVFFDSRNITVRESYVTYTLSPCKQDNVTTTVTDTTGHGKGVGHIMYKQTNSVTISSLFELSD